MVCNTITQKAPVLTTQPMDCFMRDVEETQTFM